MVLSLYTQPHYSNLGWPPVTIRQVSTEQERVTVIPNMFLEAHRQRKISDISTLARVVHKTHKAKLNFVRKCKL